MYSRSGLAGFCKNNLKQVDIEISTVMIHKYKSNAEWPKSYLVLPFLLNIKYYVTLRHPVL